MESTTYSNGNGNGNGNKEKAMETIAKCLRLAADPGATEGEREAAARMAERVMAKWQISSLEMRLKSENGSKPRTTESVKEDFEGVFDPSADWEFLLSNGIARTFGCICLTIDHRTRIHFFGSKSDLEVVNFFFSKLRLEIDSWAEEAYSQVEDRRSYAYGMVNRVDQKLDELYRVVQNEMPNDCKALVVMDKALVVQKTMEVYPKQQPQTPKQIKNLDAYRRGFADAGSLNLSSNRQQVR